jgi:diguanylate cyclase
MNNNNLSPEQILAFGKQANDLMQRHASLPFPENYELWYWYASQGNEALISAVDTAIKEGRAGDPEQTKLIHARFFGTDAHESFEEIGLQLNAELQKLMESMTRAGEDTAAFDQTLSNAGAELDRGGAPDIKGIVQKLSAATRAVQARNRKLEEQLQASAKEVDGMRSRMETIRKESLTDPLTGLANRRCFEDSARRAIDAAVTERRPMSLIISDVDHFKKFNDTYGHTIGDQVLRLVGQCLRSNVKGKDLAARFGGEEFIVILPETPLENAVAVANDIRKTVETKKIVQRSTGKDMGTVTLSLGVAQYIPGEQIADLINRADACLYAAKRAGRNCVVTERDLLNATASPSANKASERSLDSRNFEYAVRAVCRQGAMPLRSHIDLRQFHRFARFMIIAEPDVDQRTMPMRLVGSGFHDLVGRDVTGLDYMEFIAPELRDVSFDTLMRIIAMPCGLWQKSPVALPNGKSAVIELTTFPMFHERENRNQLICLARYQTGDSMTAASGQLSVQKAVSRGWIDLGKGVPGADRDRSAA